MEGEGAGLGSCVNAVGMAGHGGEWTGVSGQNPTPPGCASGRIWLPSTGDGRTKAGAV